MKKLLIIALCVFGITACEKQVTETKLDDNKVYFFYQSTCPHCHHALEHINHVAPNLDMQMVEIAGSGRNLFIKCVQKFNLPREQIGTPLICMGDHYIMGWSEIEAVKFDEYVKSFMMTVID